MPKKQKEKQTFNNIVYDITIQAMGKSRLGDSDDIVKEFQYIFKMLLQYKQEQGLPEKGEAWRALNEYRTSRLCGQFGKGLLEGLIYYATENGYISEQHAAASIIDIFARLYKSAKNYQGKTQ